MLKDVDFNTQFSFEELNFTFSIFLFACITFVCLCMCKYQKCMVYFCEGDVNLYYIRVHLSIGISMKLV